MQYQHQNDLCRALHANEIVPYFQPIVELRSGQLSGFEVLARWRHPEHGIIPPLEFIPLAEETGLIGLLTEKILTQAFTMMSHLPCNLSLAVNVSPVSMHEDTIPGAVEQAAKQSGFNLSQLTIEITESAVVRNLENARVITRRLKEMGVRLAIDDFGTGYSSLANLSALPFDEIKVDASFVRCMSSSKSCRKIVAAVLGLGQSLGLQTVAEGIEEAEQADMLFHLGCDLVQGYLYGRPVPASDVPAILERRSLFPAAQHALEASAENDYSSISFEAMPTQSLPQLQAIYNGAPVGLCYLDRNLRYININKRLAEMNGLPISAHLGRTVEEAVPEVYQHLRPYLERALKGEPTTEFEVSAYINGPDAPPRTCMVTIQPAYDEACEIVGVSGAVVDITQLKEVREALRESEEHYRYAAELNPEITWTASPDGRILECGQRWTELTGLTQEESRGSGWLSVVHPDDLEHTKAIWQKVAHTGERLDNTYRVRRPNGDWHWVRSRAGARRDAEGRIVKWYGVLDDIDEHYRLMEQFRQTAIRLQTALDVAPMAC